MAEIFILRDGLAWSRWYLARFAVDGRLERAGLARLPGEWVEETEGLRYTGDGRVCEAIAVALEGLGLSVTLRVDAEAKSASA